MKYYFFQTSMKLRNGETKPTLRALPGQTFEDGTPVDTSVNVQAPKEPGMSPYGTRLEYPTGTIFGCDHLKTYNNFYTVYTDMSKAPNFHPIADNPNFQYVKPEHMNAKMNAAYALFQAGIDYEDNDDAEIETESSACDKTSPSQVFTPADANGMARPADANWTEKYQGQLEEEAQMFGKWLRNLFGSKKITLPFRIVMSSVMDDIEHLYRTGESIDSLASRARFEAFLKAEKITYDDFRILKDGPLKKYIGWVKQEHDKGLKCTATERDIKDRDELNDAVTMICDAHNTTTGVSSLADDTDIQKIGKAIDNGWSLDELLDPENLKKADSVKDYASKLADGTIELPQRVSANGAPFVDMLLADKKNRRPRDKDGFHVDEKIWKILILNLNKKRNTLLTGPSGSGKTEIVRRLCEQTGTPFTLIQMGSITDPTEQLVGKMDFDVNSDGKAFVFDWAEFALAIQRPGVVLLDEINRIPKNGENTLFSCLDNTRELSAAGAKSSDTRTIKVHPDCCFFATANIGDEFTGTKQIDGALKTRFMPVELDYMTQKEEVKILKARTGINEDDADNIAFIANQIRRMAAKNEVQATISTRETLTCAELVRDGIPVLEAMEFVFLPLFDKGIGNNDASSERAQIKQIISQRFNNRAA